MNCLRTGLFLMQPRPNLPQLFFELGRTIIPVNWACALTVPTAPTRDSRARERLAVGAWFVAAENRAMPAILFAHLLHKSWGSWGSWGKCNCDAGFHAPQLRLALKQSWGGWGKAMTSVAREMRAEHATAG